MNKFELFYLTFPQRPKTMEVGRSCIYFGAMTVLMYLILTSNPFFCAHNSHPKRITLLEVACASEVPERATKTPATPNATDSSTTPAATETATPPPANETATTSPDNETATTSPANETATTSTPTSEDSTTSGNTTDPISYKLY